MIYILCLSVWVFVCLYPINAKTAEPHDPGVGLRLIKFSKIHEIFCLFLFCVNVHKKNMFTIEVEDGHKAP